MSWNRWWCPIIILVLLVIVIRCWYFEKKPPIGTSGTLGTSGTTTTSADNLIIKHRDAGDWIDFSNAFVDVACDPTTNPSYRTGLLFQFGGRSGRTAYVYDEIRIYPTGAAAPTVYEKFVWVNVVSQHADTDPPIQPDLAFGLYPNASTFYTAAGLELACSDVTPYVAGGCSRNRCIAADMDSVQAVLTYWQGVNGWKASASQELGACSGNTTRFSFLDPFTVEVYEPADPINDATMPEPTIFAAVDSIVVAVSTGSPDSPDKQTPPWLYP
jgi:hypothetical protein